MKRVLLIALVGAVLAASPLVVSAQDVSLEDVVAAALQPQPAPARAPAAPVAPATVPPPAQPAPPAPPAPFVRSGTNNVKFDVTITDTAGPKPVTKTVSMTVAPGNNGSIRSSAKAGDTSAGTINPAVVAPTSWLNVDVRGVNTIDANTVRAQISVEYQAYVADAKLQPGAVSANSTSIFTDGRRTQILVTSDPASDRRTTIEVTATILK